MWGFGQVLGMGCNGRRNATRLLVFDIECVCVDYAIVRRRITIV